MAVPSDGSAIALGVLLGLAICVIFALIASRSNDD